MPRAFRPYANEADVLQVSDLDVENRLDRIAIFGSVDLTRDKAGLRLATALKTLLDAVVLKLQEEERDNSLPETIRVPKTAKFVKNPLA
jgi:hypothetical protein